MARKVQVLIVDDLDGGDADETVTFAIDGTAYEIDLSSDNAGALRNGFARYTAAGRRLGRASIAATRTAAGTATVKPPRASTSRDQNQAIREWAKANGLEVSDRGRIPAEIVEKYTAAH